MSVYQILHRQTIGYRTLNSLDFIWIRWITSSLLPMAIPEPRHHAMPVLSHDLAMAWWKLIKGLSSYCPYDILFLSQNGRDCVLLIGTTGLEIFVRRPVGSGSALWWALWYRLRRTIGGEVSGVSSAMVGSQGTFRGNEIVITLMRCIQVNTCLFEILWRCNWARMMPSIRSGNSWNGIYINAFLLTHVPSLTLTTDIWLGWFKHC